jgi:hypothetical protein
MLVDAGRLGRTVVENWKQPHANAPAHPVNAMPEATVGDVHQYHAIPHHVDPMALAAAEVPMHVNPLHYPFLHPPHPAFPMPLYPRHLPPPGIDPHQIMAPPAFAYHPAADENAHHVANQTDPNHHEK